MRTTPYKLFICLFALLAATAIPVTAKKTENIPDPNLRLHYNSPAKL